MSQDFDVECLRFSTSLKDVLLATDRTIVLELNALDKLDASGVGVSDGAAAHLWEQLLLLCSDYDVNKWCDKLDWLLSLAARAPKNDAADARILILKKLKDAFSLCRNFFVRWNGLAERKKYNQMVHEYHGIFNHVTFEGWKRDLIQLTAETEKHLTTIRYRRAAA